ncbi:MAG: hypothetical protein ABL961_13520, partial [Vicinamibacterales bacterium]
TGVNLLRTDATGRTLAVVGVMHDDGVNGDAVAGDRTFSYLAVTTASAPGTTYYRVSAPFRGVLLRALSPVVSVSAVPPPTISVTLSPVANANGWRSTPVTAHFTCGTSPGVTIVCPPDRIISTELAGQQVTGTVTDSLGGSASVTSPPFNIDQVPPSVSVHLDSAPNASGIFTSAVTAHFTCADALSGVASCPADQIFSDPGTNLVAIGTATDAAGNSATATSAPFTIRLAQPTITIDLSPPANANGWRNTPVTAHFTCTQGGLPLAGCPADRVITADGANQTVTGSVTDAAGLTASVTSIPFNIDRTPPSLTVTLSPPSSNGYLNEPVTAHFTCSDAGSGVDTCPLPEVVSAQGANQTVTATVADNAGNTASVTSDPFSIDFLPPTITVVLTPSPNASGWNHTPVTAHFVCTDAGSGVAACPPDRVVTTDGAGQSVSGVAIDHAGNTQAASAVVNIDTIPPTLVLASPADGSVLLTPLAAVAGTVADDRSGVAGATCNGAAATLGGTSIGCQVALAAGSNTVVATATDVAGNTTTTSLQVTFTRPPAITITSPQNLSYLNISPTTVTGTVEGAASVVVINSVQAPVINGSFSVPLPLAEGPNIVTASATGPGGAIGTASITVTLDTTPPHVTITTPTDEFVTADASISLAGNINDIVVGTVNDEQAQVSVNGTPARVANRTFLVTDVPLALGPNILQAVGRDRAGNAATSAITVTRRAATPSGIRLVSGNNQTAPIGSVLGEPLVIALTDGLGAPVPNKPVIFKATQNDGVVAADGPPAATVVATTDAQGHAPVRWTLGNRAGAGGNTVEAYAVGFDGTAIFTASGTPGPAGRIVADTGNEQTGATGQSLPRPFIAVVVDGGNNRLGGIPVTFTVRQGGGTFDGAASRTAQTDSDGRVAATLTLGFQEGNANNVVEATFPSNAGLPAAFTASGRAAGNPSDTTISGVVLDNSNAPIQGVTVRGVLTDALHSSLSAVQAAVAVLTNAQGQFVIPQAPVGLVKLLVDGSTAQRPGTYPALEYDIVTVAGHDNTVGQPIYLLPLTTTDQLCVTATTGGGTLTLPESPGFSLTFAPGQVTFPGGSKTGCVSVTAVHRDKVPMVPAFGQQARFIVTIQPAGALFNPPAPITLPNVDGLRPREVTELYSFDHDIGAFVAIGTGVVSDDGQVIRSSAGVGVLKAGWHGGGNPTPSGSAGSCGLCLTTQGNQCVPDNSQTPPQTPLDCRIDRCNNGAVVSDNSDVDHDNDKCCYQGDVIDKRLDPADPKSDLSKCPNRVPSNRPGEYDGCSLPTWIPGPLRNNPAQGAHTLFSDHHLADDNDPATQPSHLFACDLHDECYQTCVTGDTTVNREVCDLGLHDIAYQTCLAAYNNPDGVDRNSGAWAICFDWADIYYRGLSPTGLGVGKNAYEDRQKQYCQCCQ